MEPAIAKELAALREEIEALRAATLDRKSSPDAEPAAQSDPIKNLFGTVRTVLGCTEATIIAHPLGGAAAAFVAGLLIGRITKSR